MKKLNTTLKVNDKVITIMHSAEAILIAHAVAFPSGVPTEMWPDNVPNNVDAYDYSDGNRYYAYYRDVDVIEAIDDVLFDQHLVRIKTWDSNGRGFEGMDGLHYLYTKSDPDDFLIESSGAERIMLIKEVYCNGDTGELCAYLVCERK